MLRHPKVAFRSCEDCRVYVYDEKTGSKSLFRGEPIRRGKIGPPCTRGDGMCPRGHYSNPVELSPQNLQAFVHYLTCKAVGSFPNDPIVERNARIIRSIEDGIEADRNNEFCMTALMLRASNV